jgi:uncharacterized protein YhfF
MPKPGDFVMIDGAGRPRFISRATEVTIKPLVEVDAAFAWDEGEGDRTRAWWLDAHRRYFARQAVREGFELSDAVMTVFERSERNAVARKGFGRYPFFRGGSRLITYQNRSPI